MRRLIGFVAAAIVVLALYLYLSGTSQRAENNGPASVTEVLRVAPSSNSLQELANDPEAIDAREEMDVDAFMGDIAPPEFEVRILDPVSVVGETWNETYSLLADDAARGDPSAQYQLAWSARNCLSGPRTREGLAEFVSLAPPSGMDAKGHFVRNEDAQAARRATGKEILAYCEGSELEELEQFPVWLEAAAEAGEPRAMLNYGVGYPGDNDLDPSVPADLREIKMRTAKHIEFLEKARAQGSIDAMMRLSSIYLNKGTLEFQKEAFANLYAYAWYRYKYEGNDGSFKYLRRIGYGMGPRDYYDAVEMGRALLGTRKCCFKVPEIR